LKCFTAIGLVKNKRTNDNAMKAVHWNGNGTFASASKNASKAPQANQIDVRATVANSKPASTTNSINQNTAHLTIYITPFFETPFNCYNN
jgi:hypothetical protein